MGGLAETAGGFFLPIRVLVRSDLKEEDEGISVRAKLTDLVSRFADLGLNFKILAFSQIAFLFRAQGLTKRYPDLVCA
jgi:hypothetical protein